MLETWSRWREQVEREGMRFAAAPEYQVFPTRERPLKPYEAAVRASAVTRELIRELDADAVVVDILTAAGGLAAQLERRPWVTLVPHVLPLGEPQLPGLRRRRGATRARAWAPRMWATLAAADRWPASARAATSSTARASGSACRRSTTSTAASRASWRWSRRCPSSSTRAPSRRRGMRVTGPLLWEQPFGEVELPPGDDPLVLVAPSTSQDPEQTLLRAALEGLADQPVRVLATINRRPPAPAAARAAQRPHRRLGLLRAHDAALRRGDLPRRSRHAGARAGLRRAGRGVSRSPATWPRTRRACAGPGSGVSLPRRFQTARGVRLALRRLLGDRRYAARAQDVRRWAEANDGAVTAADAVEELAERRRSAPGVRS